MKDKKILVIEDDVHDRELLVRAMRHLDRPIIPVATFSEAQRAFDKHHRFAAVFIDLALPDTHGLHAIAWIKQHHAGTPIFVLTGREMDAANRSSLYDAGAVVLFTKPYSSMDNTAVLNLLDVTKAAYAEGFGRRSWRTSICAAASIVSTLASVMVDPHLSDKLMRVTAIFLAVGLLFGADARAVVQLLRPKPEH